MTRIAFLVSSLGASQLAYHILHEADRHLRAHNDIDLLVFYHNVTKMWKYPSFSMLNMNEAYDFSGSVVATDLETAERMLHMPGPRSRLFYAWDLEWLVGREAGSYEQMASVYRNPAIRLVARGEDHARRIAESWNRPVAEIGVVNNCNLSQLAAVINEEGR